MELEEMTDGTHQPRLKMAALWDRNLRTPTFFSGASTLSGHRTVNPKRRERVLQAVGKDNRPRSMGIKFGNCNDSFSRTAQPPELRHP